MGAAAFTLFLVMLGPATPTMDKGLMKQNGPYFQVMQGFATREACEAIRLPLLKLAVDGATETLVSTCSPAEEAITYHSYGGVK